VVIKGVDLASYQGAPDFARVRAAGYEFGITKVTEGLSYTFPGFRRNRTEMARAGMAVGFYHFARGGDPGKEANYFLAAIGKLEPGEVLALDWEISNVQNPVEWCRLWLAEAYRRTGVRPLVYLNMSTVKQYNWSPVANAGYQLWLAQYDGKPNFPGVPHWGTPIIKQYHDAGTVPGINGKVDLNVCNGDRGLLRRFGATPASAVAPASGPDTLPELCYGDKGAKVESLQKFLNAYPWKPPLPALPVTGNYLDQTTEVIRGAQIQMGISGGDGRNLGPQTRRGLWDRGWRG
jgi:lysozyme